MSSLSERPINASDLMLCGTCGADTGFFGSLALRIDRPGMYVRMSTRKCLRFCDSDRRLSRRDPRYDIPSPEPSFRVHRHPCGSAPRAFRRDSSIAGRSLISKFWAVLRRRPHFPEPIQLRWCCVAPVSPLSCFHVSRNTVNVFFFAHWMTASI